MRRFNAGRFGLCVGLVVTLLVVTMASLSVQAGATPEPTVNPMLATMVAEKGACPQGSAEAMLKSMATEEAAPVATEEAAVTSEPTTTAGGGVKCLYGAFSGTAEVSAPGASGAVGFVFLSVHPNTGNLCYDVAVAHITLPATELHINRGSAGHTGVLAVSLHPRPDANGLAEGCVAAGKTVVTDIAKNPANYFVNVSTTDFKNGAARAQLEVYGAAVDMSATPIAPEATVAVSG